MNKPDTLELAMLWGDTRVVCLVDEETGKSYDRGAGAPDSVTLTLYGKDGTTAFSTEYKRVGEGVHPKRPTPRGKP